MATLLTAIALLLAAFGANAISIEDCEGAPSSEEAYSCLMGKYDEADRSLNSVYQQLKNECYKRDAEAFAHLQRAQRAWIPFRDANCAHAGYNWPGVPNVGKAHCYARMTIEREVELFEINEDCMIGR